MSLRGPVLDLPPIRTYTSKEANGEYADCYLMYRGQCAACAKVFRSHRPDAVFCSAACRVRSHRRHKNPKKSAHAE